jgi:hypothetical protein
MSALSTPVPHPLAQALIARYRADALAGPVLEVHAGRGRNTVALEAAGIAVVATRDDEPYTQLPGPRDGYAAALSTHGFLHGTTAKLRLGIGDLRRVLKPGAPAYLTLGSLNDPRFGFGLALDERTFAPGDGPEAGIPHAFFERDGILDLFRGFTIESLEEVDVTTIVGTWAHPDPAAERIVHWFVVARKAGATPPA